MESRDFSFVNNAYLIRSYLLIYRFVVGFIKKVMRFSNTVTCSLV